VGSLVRDVFIVMQWRSCCGKIVEWSFWNKAEDMAGLGMHVKIPSRVD
jgi:hypothetical protein